MTNESLDTKTSTVQDSSDQSEPKKKFEEYLETLAALDSEKKHGSLMHNDPDPDELGATQTHCYIASKLFGLEFDKLYAGEIGFPNVLMVQALDLEENLIRYDDKNRTECTVDVSVYDSFSFIDHYGSNASLYKIGRRGIENEKILLPDDKIKVHVDHHDLDKVVSFDPAFSHRSKLHSSCSIFTSYLMNGLLEKLNLEDPRKDPEFLKIIHGLMYGIRSDTDQLGTASPEDVDCFHFLTKFGNIDFVIKNLEKPDVPREWRSLQRKAYTYMEDYEGNMFTSVGFIERKNKVALAMIADELLRTMGIHTVYVWGIMPDEIAMSIRTKDIMFNYDEKRDLFKKASGGGRTGAGGIQIPNLIDDFEVADMTNEERGQYINFWKAKLERKLFNKTNQ